LLVIDHGSLRSTLEPVNAAVKLGQTVTAGQLVGWVSNEPTHTPNVLHWGVRQGTQYIDPAKLVETPPRAVLLATNRQPAPHQPFQRNRQLKLRC
jgi:murein DD-endopeptidase MepM/ murein hydrolase activator NlpD